MQNLPSIVQGAIDAAGIQASDLDAIAVTRGPGLPPCLSAGMNAAKTLAAVLRKPILGVHHMEAHALTARLTTKNAENSHVPSPVFPFITLLISGGHTLILLAQGVGRYKQLGTTLDDAVGEAIDKAARGLQLSWATQGRGGPGVALELAASNGRSDRFKAHLPLPMSDFKRAKELNFSFSGLKTAMNRLISRQDLVDLTRSQDVNDLAAAFQERCADHLAAKLELALEQCRTLGLTALVASGGVASNQTIRNRLSVLSQRFGLPLICPPPELCTDNGVMIAWTGIERLQAGMVDDYEMTTMPRWPIEDLDQEHAHAVAITEKHLKSVV
ncbi:hypothetical protein BZG36_00903 [Bifiguratus adelaidae]|uniref:N(6)-L-threonylcarbamoyladenine synthase n=1 Tax=Bifiguratus adelaidae TaxID=1938954 RepID=A0A261Y5J4_9FUNG|nr:hypothetical protein BZG36_00903 [Bifiguratus adelaidae]